MGKGMNYDDQGEHNFRGIVTQQDGNRTGMFAGAGPNVRRAPDRVPVCTDDDGEMEC